MSFSGNDAFILGGDTGVDRLKHFQQTLGLALTKAGLGRHVGSQFTPHMTLLYDRQAVAKQHVEAVSWTVNEFVLVHSLLGRTQHLILGRWPLRSP